jgi:tetratricopeptide (TPR) repeat protein
MHSTQRNPQSGVPTHLALLFVAMFAVAPAVAQDEEAAPPPPAAAAAPGQEKPLPPMRLELGDMFARAQTCLEEEDDIECAKDIIERANRLRNLNNHEMAQLLNFTAYVAFEEEDTEGAIRAFEQIKALPIDEMPKGLVSAAWRNLATLYVEQEEYQKGLEGYKDWMNLPFVAPTVTSRDWFFLSQLYYLVEDFPNGLTAVDKAIEMEQAQGNLGEETWWSMRYYFLYQLERTDEAIETLIVLVENWTKRNWLLSLAGQLADRGEEEKVLSLYSAAYEKGWLERSTEKVQMANLYLNADMPLNAARVLQVGLDSGDIESTQQNWRMLAQAWQMTRDDIAALPALRKASELAEDGEVDRMLATSYARLGRWEECADAAQSSLDRGGLDRPDYVYMQLGRCKINLREYDAARAAFVEAARDERQKEAADQFLSFINVEVERTRRNEETLRSLGQ